MDNFTNSPRNTIGDRAGPGWQQFPADAYLDHRHRNWVISEEMGDVRFVPEGGVVVVHRVRAEHIARALGWAASVALPEEVLALPTTTAPEPVRLPVLTAAVPARESRSLAAGTIASRRRDIGGWLGIIAGGVLFVATLAVPLDDPALVVALALAMRGSR